VIDEMLMDAGAGPYIAATDLDMEMVTHRKERADDAWRDLVEGTAPELKEVVWYEETSTRQTLLMVVLP
jgi:hypothetical protein